jgi:hypothetical protein
MPPCAPVLKFSSPVTRTSLFRKNLATRRIAIVVLMTNRGDDIRTEPQTVHHAVDNATPGTVTAARFLPRGGSRPPPDPKP